MTTDCNDPANAHPTATASAAPLKRTCVRLAAVATPGLSLFLIRKRTVLKPEEYENLVAEISDEFEAYTAALLATPPGAARARVLHQRMDEAMELNGTIKLSCYQGCGGCCHHEVEVTGDEADLLANLVHEGLKIDRARLAQQANRPRKSPDWAVPLSRQSRCVFLGAGDACDVYPDRPAVCRKHAVVSPPQACVTIGATTSPVQVPRAEILLSAALAIKGTCFNSLPKAVVSRLGT